MWTMIIVLMAQHLPCMAHKTQKARNNLEKKKTYKKKKNLEKKKIYIYILRSESQGHISLFT